MWFILCEFTLQTFVLMSAKAVAIVAVSDIFTILQYVLALVKFSIKSSRVMFFLSRWRS